MAPVRSNSISASEVFPSPLWERSTTFLIA